MSIEIVEAFQLFEEVDVVLVDSKVSHALDGDASLLLDLCSEIKPLVASIHDEADALHSLSEEGELHHEVGSLREAFISQEVLVRAFREEQRPTRLGSLLKGGFDIEAERLVLSIVVDIA